MRDIDREVAEKVMGWMYKPSKSTVERGIGRLPATIATYHTPDGKARIADSFLPSTRIDHAWEVVEKMRDRGWQVSVESPDPWGDDGPHIWGCDFFCDSLISGKAETAPLAICKAALAAVNEAQ